jgi:hypothetical protein
MLLNSIPIVPLDTLKQPNIDEYPEDTFKNVEYKNLRNRNISPYCRNVIDIMYSYVNSHKRYIYVFIQVQDLEVGNNTSGTGHWHLDSDLNAGELYENYIFITGFHNTTEFFKTPIEIDSATSSSHFNEQIEKQYYKERDSQLLEPTTIYKYNGSNVHRGRVVKVAERRMLIRMSNTDKRLTTYNML